MDPISRQIKPEKVYASCLLSNEIVSQIVLDSLLGTNLLLFSGQMLRDYCAKESLHRTNNVIEHKH